MQEEYVVMGIPRFFKIAKPRQFNYTPLYHDPDKEDLEDRIRAIKQEMGIEVSDIKRSTTIKRGSFRKYSKNAKRKANRESNLRLIMIVAVLLILAYLIFYR